MEDKRFASIGRDPLFRRPKARQKRVTIDDRFKSVFDAKEKEAPVDKYGRSVRKQKSKFDAKRFYQLEDELPERSNEQPRVTSERNKFETQLDRARGGGFSSSSSDDDSISDGSSDGEDYTVHAIAGSTSDTESIEYIDPEPDRNAIQRGNPTSRLAAVNMDWDNLRAEDLLATLSSFAESGSVKRVAIYMSDFGKKRIEEEAVRGPPSEIFAPMKEEAERNSASYSRADSSSSDEKSNYLSDNENEEDGTLKSPQDNASGFQIIADEIGDDELDHESSENNSDDEARLRREIIEENTGEEFDMKKLRSYQLERLRYFYAIIECDSVKTAKRIYDSCDGTEYENSANYFDLRFVPEDVKFAKDDIHEECTEVSSHYEPTEFVTDALQHSKIKLTWDADDPRRKRFTRTAFTSKDLKEDDYRAYIASSGSDTDGENEQLEKEDLYRKLLQETKGENVFDQRDFKNDQEFQIQFAPALSSDKSKIDEFQDETTIEKYKRKEKERKKAKSERRKNNNENIQVEEDLGFDDPFFQLDPNEVDRMQKKEKSRHIKEGSAVTWIDGKSKWKKKRLEVREVDPDIETVARELEADDDGRDHFDMKAVTKSEKKRRQNKRKGRLEEIEGVQESFNIDLADPRFSELYESHHYAIDPSNPHFKKTKTMDKILTEKRRRTHDTIELEEQKARRH